MHLDYTGDWIAIINGHAISNHLVDNMIALPAFPIYQKQADFRTSGKWLRGFVGGRGTGKTTIGAADLIFRANNKDSMLCVSPSFPMLKDSALPVFEETADRLKVLIKITRGSGSPEATFKTRDGGKARVTFRTGEKPESLRGGNHAGVWYDEASIMVEDCFLLGIATLRHRGQMGFCTMTFTPQGKRHWTYDAFFVRDRDTGEYSARDKSFLVQAHTLDNPFLHDDFFSTMRGRYTSVLAEQELAGSFIELQGLLFFRDWFEIVDSVPAIAARVRYWDKASTEGGGCYTAGVLMARTLDKTWYVEDVVRGQWSYGDRDKVMLDTAERDAQRYDNSVHIYVEQEGGSGGKESALRTIRMLSRHPIHRDIVSQGRQLVQKDGRKMPGKAKVVRAQTIAAQAEARNVKVVKGSWNEDWLYEMCAFPEFSEADQVDASSGAFNMLEKMHGIDVGDGQPSRLEVPKAEDYRSRYGVLLDRRVGNRGRTAISRISSPLYAGHGD